MRGRTIDSGAGAGELRRTRHTLLLDPNDRLLTLAREGVRLTPPVVAVLLAFAFLFARDIPRVVLSSWITWLDDDGRSRATLSPTVVSLWLTLRLIVVYAPLAVLVIAWVWIYERRPPRTLGMEARRRCRQWIRGLLVGAGMFAAAVAVLAAFGAVHRVPSLNVSGAIPLVAGMACALVGWAVQASSEEILCRGWLLGTVGAGSGAWWGLSVSSVIFGALHFRNPGLTWLSFSNLCLAGAFFGLYALWEGSIWGVCAVHASWNWAQGSLLGLSVSGSASPTSLVNLRASGPGWFTGGRFGPEGGVAVTLVEAAGVATVLVLLWHRRHSRPQETPAARLNVAHTGETHASIRSDAG